MKIINIPFPSGEYLDAKKKQYIRYSVKTEKVREKEGGFSAFMKEKEELVKENDSITGIFLYDVKALIQEITGEGWDMVYYIRYDYNKKENRRKLK